MIAQKTRRQTLRNRDRKEGGRDPEAGKMEVEP